MSHRRGGGLTGLLGLALAIPAFAQPGTVKLTPQNIHFGQQYTGASSAPAPVTLTNNLSGALTIASITVSPGFQQTNNCGASVPSKGQCTINVIFAPATNGSFTGSLTVTDNSPDSPQIVGLTGTGIDPVTVSPASLNYGSQTVGTTSASKAVTITNNLTTALTFTGISASSEFKQTNNCGSSLAPAAQCVVNVSFAPAAAGTRTGTLTISDNAATSPQLVALSGAGSVVGLTSITVTPANPSIPLGLKQQFIATGTFNNGTTQDLTSAVTWSSSATGIATIGAGGLATSVSQGSTTITATSGAISGSTTFTVTAPALVSIAVTPSNPSIPLGKTQQFTATGTYTDNSTQNLTASVTWASSGAAATINAAGLATSVFQGSTTISATSGAISGSTTFTVTAPALVSIAVTPSNPSIPLGKTQQFTATGTYTNNTTQDLTASVTWASSGAAATINAAGLATSVSQGSTTISATSGAISGSTTLTVTAPALVSIAVTPSNPSVIAGLTQQFTATGTYTNGSTQSLTPTWSSSNTAVATIGASGLSTGVATGTTSISATIGAISGSVTLTVTSPFTATGSMTTPRGVSKATLLNNGKVLITGGFNGSYLATAELYDPAGGTFLATGDMTTTRYWHGATLLNSGKVLITGGINGSAELYDPGTGTFTATGNMTDIRSLHTATLLNNGKVLITGGYATLDASSAEVYDPATGTFIATGKMTSPRYYHTATLLNNGKVLIIGGVDGHGGFLNSAELYDPSTGTFTATGSLAAVRYNHTATLLNGGKILVTGGFNGGAVVASAELYDPTTGTFTGQGGMIYGRFEHTATLLTDGRVLITGGGQGGGVFLSASELYDPATGTFTAGGTMTTVRYQNTATLLNNGKVLITGGQGAAGYLSSAELYQPATLTPAGLLSINITPANPTISLGGVQQFIATGTFSDGARTLTSVTWSSSNPAVATISNDAGNHGVAAAAAIGTTTITASAGAVNSSTTLTVSRPVLLTQVDAGNSIPIHSNFSLLTTGVAQKVAIANPISPLSVTLQFLNTFGKTGSVYVDLVKDDGTGKPSALPADILATSAPQPPGLTGAYTFTFPSGTVPAGTFHIVLRTQNVAPYTYSTYLVVTGRTSAPAGLSPVQIQDPTTGSWSAAAPQQFLTFTLSAASATTSALSSVTVTPASPAIETGKTQQLSAIGVNSDGTMQVLTNTAAWTSGTPSAATVNAAGLVNGAGIGTSVVSASSGGRSGSTTVTVGSPLHVTQSAADTSTLIYKDFGVLVSGVGQRVILTAPITALSVTTQIRSSFAVGGYIYVDLVKDDGSGKPSNAPSDIIATSIDKFWTFESDRTCTFNFPPTAVPGGPFHIVLRTQAVTAVTYSSLSAVTGSTSSLGGLDAATVQNPSTLAWSAASPAQYLAFTLNAVTTSGAVYNALTALTVTPASASIPKGTTQQFTATGTYADGTTKNLTSSVAWVSSNTTAATIGSTGLATSVATGSSSITASLYGVTSNSASLTVAAPALVSIAVAPANPSIPLGKTQQFTATGTYTDNTTQNLTSSVTWASSGAAATINAAGLATSASQGSTTISATSGAISGTTSLTVTPPALLSIAVTPASPSIALGATQQFTATGTYTDNSTQNLTASVTWNSASTSVATINASGLATGAGPGSTTISAVSGAISGSATLTVYRPALLTQVNTSSSIPIHSNYNAVLTTGVSQKLVIGNPITVQSVTLQFRNTFGKQGYVYVDLVKDDGTGKPSNLPADIIGTSTQQGPGLTGSYTFTFPSVNVPTGTFHLVLRTQNITPYTYSTYLVITGRTAAPAAMDPVLTQDPSNSIWSVASPQQYLAFSLSAVSTAASSLTAVSVTPASPAIAVTQTQQLAALGLNADGTMQDLTGSALWNSGSPSIASVNTSGLATGSAIGTSLITASSGGFNGSTTLTVGSPLTVQQTASDSSILVQQDYGPLLTTGIGQRLTLTAPIVIGSVAVQIQSTFAKNGYLYVDIVKDDGAGKPSNSPANLIATSTDTLWTFAGPDTYTFHFLPVTVPGGPFHIVLRTQNIAVLTYSTFAGITGSTSSLGGLDAATVQDPTTLAWSTASPTQYLTFALNAVTTSGAVYDGLTALTVTPTSASIPKGTTQQFTATGTYADGTTKNLTSSVAWVSSNTAAATIGSSGLATSVATGSSSITASLYGVTSNSASLTVTTPNLVSISVTPTNPSVTAGQTQQFSATGNYSDNSTQNITSSVTWSSSANATATVNSAGLATGVAQGNASIIATLGAVTGSTVLTVTAPTLVSITVTPANVTIAAGATQQFTATGTYTDNSTQNITASVTWASSANAVATINNSGLATGMANGSTTITATLGAVSGSTTLNVSVVFTSTGSMSIARRQQTATRLNDGRVLIVGGDGPGAASTAIYDPATGLWSSTGSMSTGRVGHSATLLPNGKVLIVGGLSGPTYQSTAEIYDPATGAFSSAAGIGAARYDHTATLLNNGKILIAGGSNSSGLLNTAVLYDPATGATSTGNLNLARYVHTATLLNDGKVLITGGFGPAVTNSVEIYDPATELFTAAGGLLTARADHTATLLSTGIVLISGGWTGSSATNRTELYDPGTRVSHGAPNLTAIRYGHTATPLASDQILIAGGSDGSGVSIASAELYTLATGAFTAAGNMTVPRSNHTATLLANGNVLIAAGSNNVATQGGLQINFLTSAEIYHPTTSTPSGLVSISLAPVNPQVSTGAVQRFTATGTFSDSSTRTLVGVNWTSSNTGVAAITNDISNYSNATALAVGSTTITASAGSVSGSTVMTVAAPTLVSIAVTPANPSVTAGATQQFTATGTYTDNSTQNLTSSVTWSSSATATATINSAGLATGVAAGSATITATSGAVNGSTTLTVTGPTLVSIAVTPANSKLFLGNTQKFTATGAYSNNSTQDITGSVTWSSSDTTLATISAAGLVTPVAKGTVTITATSGAVSGNTSLTIASYVLVSEAAAEVVTSPRSTAAPSRLLFPYVFTQSGFDTEITISNTSQDPLGTASQNGTCNLNFYGNAASITQTASIAAGKQLIFSVMQGGSGMAAYPNFSGYLIATCDFPLARGSARIYGGIIAYSQDAQPITLPRSTATPTALLLPFVNTQSGFDTFIAITNTSKDPYGTTAGSGACSLNFYGVNAPANPASTGTIAPGGAYFNLASFLAPNFQGYAIATCNFADAAGAVFVSDSGARNIMLPSTPELLTVPRDPTLRPLLFSAVNSQNGLDTTLAIANTSKDPFGTSITSGACTLNFFGTNAPAAVTTPTINAGSVYTTLASAIAPNFQGYVTASCPFTMARGWMYTIPAGNHGEGDGLIPEVVSQPRSVTPAALMFSSVSNINGADTRISILNTSQDPFGTASAAGSCVISYFGDVSGGNVPAAQTSTSIQPGDQLSFTLSQGNAAQGIAGAPGFRGYVIANCGFPLARGVATIFSQAGVTVPQLQAIAVTPASPSIVAGTTQQFTATGTYTDSSTRDLTRTTVWSSNTPATATINSAGLATGVAAGSTTIKATSASSNGTTVLTVTAPTLVSIAVTPANPTISISQTQQFTATGTYSNNTTQNLTGSVTWTSSATGVATINSSGLASPVAGGSTTITATLGAVSGSTGLTVNAPTIVSIALSPQSPTLRIGSILQFSAIATLSDNSTLDVTSTATWSSSQPTFISVSSTGLATALTQAFATITVSQGSAGASTQVQGIPPFTATGSMGAARRGPMATLLNNGKVLITGGSNSSILATATLYDPAAGTFTATGSMTTARGVHTATLLNNGKVLIAGGSNGSADLSTAELYDPATGTFTATGSMVTGARGAHTATLLNNGKVLIAGGVFVSGITSTPLTTAELYDPATGTFTATGSLIAARYGATATLLNSGKVLVAGGFNASADLSSAELFDPAAGTFSSAGSMKAARSSYTATLLNGGNVLLAGGSSGSAYTASAEVYDPVAGTFTFTGSMSEARGAHAASLLNSGKVLITGGRFTNTANVYDPATGQFAGGIAMSVNRENHTSTLLTDGRVLLAGGDNPTPLSSAELYITNALTPAGLLSISVTPANLSISAPAALHYQATGTFTGNVQQTLASATWSSSNTGIAAIANDAGSAGWANATGTLGTTTITAAAGSVSGSTSLTMTAPVLVSIAVTPANPSISTAQTQQFTATGTYSNNTTQNLTGSVSWTSSATGVATINSSGLASAVATGSTTITATSGAISGATGLTVNAPTIVSIFVVPANTTIRVGSTQQFAAIALLSDNSTQDVTASVNWSSSLPSYIPISSTGLVTALNAAFTTISASKDSFSASTQAQAISPFTGGGSISMPSTRKSHTATVLNNGQVLIAGGFNSLALATAALYNSNGTFTATGGSMITARVFHTATLLNNGKVLIAGGFNGSTYLSGAELFDPATGTFTATGSLVTGARAHHTATLLNNGKVLIAGGLFSNGATTTPLASAELYDPADGTFTATGSLAATRYTATATLLNNGKVLVAGGFNASVDLNSAELFDPAAGSFTSAGSSMTAARSSHTATLLNGGKVLLAGGSSGSTFTASAEVYDPVAGTFTATTGNLSEARVSHAASLLNSGKVLLTGGRFTDTADVYDPATGLFAGGIAMSVKRENHTSTLLPNGQVLLAGGDNPTVLSSAELYITNVLTPSGLLSISVAPASQTISAWGSTRYQATGTFSGNAQQTLASATWSSSNPSVATIANDSGSAGWAAGTGLIGTTLITATAGSVSSSTGLTTQPTDLVADFQSSPFSYGWTASQGGAFNVYTVQDTTTFPGATELLRSGPAGTPPYVAKNTTCCDLNIGQQFTMPPNQLHMHPGPNGEYTVVRFTVPAGGTYTLAGQFGWLDNATTDVHILRNNVSIFDGAINGSGSTAPFNQSVALNAGDRLDFIVGFGSNGTYFSDSTVLKGTISKLN